MSPDAAERVGHVGDVGPAYMSPTVNAPSADLAWGCPLPEFRKKPEAGLSLRRYGTVGAHVARDPFWQAG